MLDFKANKCVFMCYGQNINDHNPWDHVSIKIL